MGEQLHHLPELLTAHLQLALVALALGLCLSLPLGVWIVRRPRLESAVLALASIIQTIPSLALLAIMVPTLSILGNLTEAHFGWRMGSIGVPPALIALSLYSVLPLLRNTVTGLHGVDAYLLEAARGVGMTPRQQLWRVELPLALPVIVAGVRTALTWVVGMAVLSTPVGAPSLGNFIFTGLQTRNFAAVYVGCLGAAGLALCLDGLVRWLEVGLRRRRHGHIIAATCVWTLLYVYIFVAWLPPHPSATPTYRVGAKTFTEQYVLAEVLAAQLRRHGQANAQVLQSMGSAVVYDALKSGAIDAYVDYAGTLWTTVMRRPWDSARGDALLPEVQRFLQADGGLQVAAALGFSNAYTLAMRQAETEARGIHDLRALGPQASGLRLAGDYEIFDRPEWHRLVAAYGLKFASQRSMDPSLTLTALHEGAVDVVTAYTTDGRLAAYKLVALADPDGVLPAYDAWVLVGPRLQRDPTALGGPAGPGRAPEHRQHAGPQPQGRDPRCLGGRGRRRLRQTFAAGAAGAAGASGLNRRRSAARPPVISRAPPPMRARVQGQGAVAHQEHDEARRGGARGKGHGGGPQQAEGAAHAARRQVLQPVHDHRQGADKGQGRQARRQDDGDGPVADHRHDGPRSRDPRGRDGQGRSDPAHQLNHRAARHRRCHLHGGRRVRSRRHQGGGGGEAAPCPGLDVKAGPRRHAVGFGGADGQRRRFFARWDRAHPAVSRVWQGGGAGRKIWARWRPYRRQGWGPDGGRVGRSVVFDHRDGRGRIRALRGLQLGTLSAGDGAASRNDGLICARAVGIEDRGLRHVRALRDRGCSCRLSILFCHSIFARIRSPRGQAGVGPWHVEFPLFCGLRACDQAMGARKASRKWFQRSALNGLPPLGADGVLWVRAAACTTVAISCRTAGSWMRLSMFCTLP